MSEPTEKPKRKPIDLASLLEKIGDQMEGQLKAFSEEIREETRREIARLEARVGDAPSVETVPLDEVDGVAAPAPNQAVTRNDLGVQAFYNNDLTRAIDYLEGAVELDPDLMEAWNNLAMAYSASNRTEKAMKAFAKAVELSPERAELINNRAVLTLLSGNPGDALASLEEARQDNDHDLAVLLNLAQAYHAMGREAQAVEAWRAAAEIDPENPEAARYAREYYEQ